MWAGGSASQKARRIALWPRPPTVSTLQSYRWAALATVLDLLATHRSLARSRATEISRRAELLTTSATLTFATDD
jgi:hypothetical protein